MLKGRPNAEQRNLVIMEMAASIIKDKIEFNKLVVKHTGDRQKEAELVGQTGDLERALETIDKQNLKGSWL